MNNNIGMDHNVKIFLLANLELILIQKMNYVKAAQQKIAKNVGKIFVKSVFLAMF